jgi:hypothetical protein
VANSHFSWAAVLMMAAMTCLDQRPVRAADGPGNESLKKHGLKMAGTLAVADLEADVKTKLTEARRLSKQLSQSLMELAGIVSPREQQKNIKALNEQIGQLKSELNAVNQQMSQLPRNSAQYGAQYGGAQLGGYNNRMGGYGGGYGASGFAANGFASSTAADEYSELLMYRTQLQEELNQDSLFINQIKMQVTDPKAKEKLDADVKQRRSAYHQSLVDLRQAVDATTAKYEEVAKNDEVTKALKLIGKGLREKPKLGPSREFVNNIKLVEKLEKAEANGETEEPQATKSRRSRSRTRGKSSSKSAAGPASAAAGNAGDHP